MHENFDDNFANLRVLLVDDDVACRRFLATGLELEGIIVTQASSAEEAMAVLKKSYFDAITTDMNLPGADGITLLRHVRETCGDIPVILITGFSSVRTAVDALKLGAQDYLPKPLESADILLGAIWKAVEHHRVTVQNRALLERVHRAEKMESLANIAGGVAHDLNNILSPMVALPDLLKVEIEDVEKSTGCDASEIKDDLDLMKMSGLRAAAVVRDLLTTSRRTNYEKRSIDINLLIKNCLESQEVKELLAEANDIVIKTDIEEQGSVVLASAAHVSRAISNLIRNGLESMDSKMTGVVSKEKKLCISSSRVLLNKPVLAYDLIEEGEYIRLRFSDAGIGVDKEALHRIFEPFFTTKKESGRSGSGLGLAVVHGIMKDHDGFIDVKSKKGEGSTFDLYFPVTSEDEEPLSSSNSLRCGDESVLVVDDEPAQRIVASRMLKKLGYSVTTVNNGRDALNLFKTAFSKGEKKPFDVILLDMIMEEDFDGLTTLEQIRAMYPVQKAIMASGYAPTGRIQSALEMGAGWIAKPYGMEDLSRCLAEKFDVESDVDCI